jgi:TPR repeat protein
MVRALSLLVVILLVLEAGAAGAQTFVAPKPEAARPRAAAPAPQRQRQRRAAPAPAAAPMTLCEQMTASWVDHRPISDFPALEGRISAEQQRGALRECELEQRMQPNDVRIAFLLARTAEVNNQGKRAVALYRQLADAGYAPALTQLARAYHFGRGVAQDRVEACRLYVEAANAGDAWALNSAANCLSSMASPRDQRMACRFFERAAAENTFQTADYSREDYCGS